MRAAIVTGPGHIEVRDRPEAERRADEYRVRTLEVGICGTDLKILAGDVPVAADRVLGHEMLGEIVEGPDGGPFAVGQRVLVDPSVSCGLCVRCRRGDAHLCASGGLMGRDLDGVFADNIVVPATQLLAVPDSIPVEHGPLLQVLGTCVHGQELVRADPGQVAVVIGLGVSGLLQVQLLKARGVDVVIGVTRSEEKLRLAGTLGADVTARPDEVAEIVRELTGGEGADLVVESSGALSALVQSVDLVRPGGTILVFGIVSATSGDFPFYQLYIKEISVVNSRAALPRDYAAAIDLVARGRVDVAPILARRFDLEDAAEALATFRDAPGMLKVTMRVSG
jgi:2-desacetyl-2-hydroxyethyl bacteriochlorophyllide A dehydrogenase